MDDFASENFHLDFEERRNRGRFIAALDVFFLDNQRYPKTALELDQFMKKQSSKPEPFDLHYLESIKVADRSFFNRHIGVHFGGLQYKTGYGISYDDFDKYQNQITFGEIRSPNTDNSLVTAYIQGCKSKMLYSYDESKQNLLVITCRDDRLTGGVIDLVDDLPNTKSPPLLKKQADKNPGEASMFIHKDTKNKTAPFKKRLSRGTLSILIHKDTKKIYSRYFWDLERNEGRIKRAEMRDWLHVEY